MQALIPIRSFQTGIYRIPRVPEGLGWLRAWRSGLVLSFLQVGSSAFDSNRKLFLSADIYIKSENHSVSQKLVKMTQ